MKSILLLTIATLAVSFTLTGCMNGQGSQAPKVSRGESGASPGMQAKADGGMNTGR